MTALIEGEADWLGILPPSQRKLIEQLSAANGGLERAAQSWLDLSTPPSISPVGATMGGRQYFDKFLDLLHEKLCSEKEEEYRNTLTNSAGLGSATFAATLTASISPALSAAPALVAPAVAVVLHIIASTGLEAWCRVQTERRDHSGEVDSQTD